MNEPDLQALERRLHTLPPLLDVPASLVAPSVQAGVADPGSPASTPQSTAAPSRAWWQPRGAEPGPPPFAS